jgi:cell division protein FtsB
MKSVKYLVSLWTAVFVYAVFSLASGAMGYSAYGHLEKEREKQQANLESLRSLNRKLEGFMDALLYDPDTIAVYAHELGYGARGERLIRIEGLPGIRDQSRSPGHILGASAQEGVSAQTIAITSLCSGLGVLAFFFVVEFLKKQLNE